VLNLAYLLDGQRLEDIELRRNDEAFLVGLGAQRIPDPTTSGDFTRRFNQDSVLTLMEAINATRQRVWEKQPGDFLWQEFRFLSSPTCSLKNYSFPAIHQHPVVKVRLNRVCKNQLFETTPFPNQV
jgi:hypothetical protein